MSSCGPKYQQNTCENLFKRATVPTEFARNFLVETLAITEWQNALLGNILQGNLIQRPDRKVEIQRNDMLFFFTEEKGASLNLDEHEIIIKEHTFDGLWSVTGDMQLERGRRYKNALFTKTGKPGNG